jgi:phosphohistidine phosphatase SixA
MRKAHRSLRRRPLFTPVWLAALGSVLAIIVALWLWEMVGSMTVSVILVRHAEKLETTVADPGLTSMGQARAQALAEVLRDVPLAAIYVTEYRRSQDTAAPVAEMTGGQIVEVPADDVPALLQQLRSHRGDVVLVVGHSDTLPGIISGLGGTSTAVGGDDYSGMFIVTSGPVTRTRVLTLRYGE